MLFTFILVVQAIVAAALVTVILMQRSEGGGLGMGGSPGGLMSARGAADFLTRATTVLATLFIVLSIALAFIAATRHRSNTVDTSLAGKTAPVSERAPATPAGGDGLGGAAQAAGQTAGNSAVPLEK
jgi:preprotein translocase subunit SecG